MFELAKAEMARRKGTKEQVVGGGRFTSKYPFSGLIECGTCGGRLRRHVRTVGSGKKVASWGCATRIVNGRQACDSHHINEDVLEATYLAALKDLIDNADEVIEIVKEGVQMSMEPENTACLAEIEEEIIALQQAALDLHRSKQRLEIGAADYAAKVKEYTVPAFGFSSHLKLNANESTSQVFFGPNWCFCFSRAILQRALFHLFIQRDKAQPVTASSSKAPEKRC